MLEHFHTYQIGDLPKEAQRLLVRRTLAAVSKTNMLPNCDGVDIWGSGAMEGLDEALVAEELAAWYRIEPSPAVRLWLLGRDGRKHELYKSLYEIALQDPDPANAALARERIKRFLTNRPGNND